MKTWLAIGAAIALLFFPGSFKIAAMVLLGGLAFILLVSIVPRLGQEPSPEPGSNRNPRPPMKASWTRRADLVLFPGHAPAPARLQAYVPVRL
jgi:chromate transport protein ChrA